MSATSSVAQCCNQQPHPPPQHVFPILDAINNTLQGRRLTSHCSQSPIVTSSLRDGSRGRILTATEVRSLSDETHSQQLSPSSNSCQQQQPSSPPDINLSVAAPPLRTGNGLSNKPSAALSRSQSVSESTTTTSDCRCPNCDATTATEMQGRNSIGRSRNQLLLQQQRAKSNRWSTASRYQQLRGSGEFCGDGCYRMRRVDRNAAPIRRNNLDGCMVEPASRCCCEGNHCPDGAYNKISAAAAAAGANCAFDCHHHQYLLNNGAHCLSNGNVTSAHHGLRQSTSSAAAADADDSELVRWDDIDLDGERNCSFLTDDNLFLGPVDDDDDDVDVTLSSARNNNNDVSGSMMVDMSAVPWGIMSRWCKYAALANLLKLWQPLEGQLFKYTNVMKGWQYRWFILNPEAGRLEYYEGASVFPSDEDSQTFTINASNGDSYRLKAFDAKERQHWVNRLRATVEYHLESTSNAAAAASTASNSKVSNYLRQQIHPSRQYDVNSSYSGTAMFNRSDQRENNGHGTLSQSFVQPSVLPPEEVTQNGIGFKHIDTSLKTCIDSLSVIQRLHKDLSAHIEALPSSDECVGRLDKELLLLKATSSATLNCLEQCLSVLHRQVMATSRLNGVVSYDGQMDGVESNGGDPHQPNASPTDCNDSPPTNHRPTDAYNNNSQHSATSLSECGEVGRERGRRADEVEDTSPSTAAGTFVDVDLAGYDEQKDVVLHLLAQLKLGMDLTKVVLPAFILEKRSLLEVFADSMAHPELFLRISDALTAEERMLAVFEWYLFSFHAVRQGSAAKKPYNPIIGECFHCSWNVSEDDIQQLSSVPTTSDSRVPPVDSDQSKLYFCAEQVSHHPPISAFYFECPSKQMYMEGSIWTRSKFMGMSIGVAMIGKVRLRLLAPGGSNRQYEDYEFSLPSVFARSILTVPWVELGDKVTIHCEQTGYSAGIIFHTKPFYGGRLHRVTGEVKNPNSEVLCRVNGEWNGSLEFTYSNDQFKIVNTSKLPVRRKRVRPIDLQEANESRRLWQHVTESLELNDFDNAAEYKRILEQSQRESERIRRESRLPFVAKYFHQVGDDWTFKTPLRPDQVDPSIC